MKIYSCWICCLLLSATATAGGTVENGGNAIVCGPADSSSAPGAPAKISPDDFYMLDYIRAISANGYDPGDFVLTKDWGEEEQRILPLLRRIAPALNSSFDRFDLSTAQIQLPGSAGSGVVFDRTWVRSHEHHYLGVPPSWHIPARCLAKATVGGAEVSALIYARVVTRVKTDNSLIYYYDPEFTYDLAANNSLQFSFLMVHEWLWDLTDDLDVNQAVNAFLHRKDLSRFSDAELRARLHDMGLKF